MYEHLTCESLLKLHFTLFSEKGRKMSYIRMYNRGRNRQRRGGRALSPSRIKKPNYTLTLISGLVCG